MQVIGGFEIDRTEVTIGAFRSYRGGHALNLKLLTQAFAAGALALETPAGRSGDRAARTALSP